MQIERIALAGLCVVYTLAHAGAARAACGDGVVEPPLELCDDGNVVMGDGCNAACQTEAGYVCTGAPSLCCFSEVASAYARQGDASLDTATGEVTLVPDMNDQTGVVWFRQPLDFTRAFTINLRLYLGTRDEAPMSNAVDSGADGGAVLFQRDPRGLTAIGAFGGELGAQGISPVLGVEFDTFNNAASYNDVTTGDEDHVSIFHTRATPALNHLTTPTCLNDGTVCQNFEDGKYHRFAVEWTGNVDKHLKVYVDGVQRIDLSHDVVADYFAGDPTNITFGFAASTGASRNLHKFCPAAPVGYSVPRDRDGDGVDDSIDLDDDGDGRPDLDETGNVFTADDPSADHDRDGTPNYNDPQYWTDVLARPADCPDVEAPFGDCDTVPTTVDADRDRIPDHLDLDSDGDGVTDAKEDYDADADNDGKLDGCTAVGTDGLCPGTRPAPRNTDGIGAIDSRFPCYPDLAFCTSTDSDMDGIPNTVECPSTPCVDTDGDAMPDAMDTDSDNDGTLDIVDPGRVDPCVPSTTAAACVGDLDGDGTPNGMDPKPADPCVPDANVLACGTGDRDGDGHTNATECPGLIGCPDTDGDGKADYDDMDSDGDGASDLSDPGRLDPCVPDIDYVGCARGDADQDGLDNGTECPNPRQCSDSNGDGKPDYQDPDQDGDGSYDGVDPAPRDPCVPNATLLVCATGDGDGDGAPNQSDPFPRDPCIPDPNAVTCAAGDRDGDGLSNGFECPAGINCVDTDGDGKPDVEDSDSDSDGVDDEDECENPATCLSEDGDGDGVPDFRDPDRPELAGGACSAAGATPYDNLSVLLGLALAFVARRRRRDVEAAR